MGFSTQTFTLEYKARSPFATCTKTRRSCPIKPHRVVDQKLLLQRPSGRNDWNAVDQDTVVGRLFLHVGMRPIGTPQHPVGEPLDQCPGERSDVIIGWAGDAHALG